MNKLVRSKFLMATAMAVAIAGLGLGASVFTHSSSAEAQDSVPGSTMVPKFSVDPLWPKPLPNHWLMGNVIGVSVDKNDDVWAVIAPARWKRKNPTSPARNRTAASRLRT